MKKRTPAPVQRKRGKALSKIMSHVFEGSKPVTMKDLNVLLFGLRKVVREVYKGKKKAW
jgi:hypothetical protein